MKYILLASLLIAAALPANAQLGTADLTQDDVVKFSEKRSDFEALCGRLSDQKCKVQILKDRLVVNDTSFITLSSIKEIVSAQGGDASGPIGRRLYGKAYDQTGIFYVDATGKPRVAVFAFRHNSTWNLFNLNLVSAKNGIYFE